MDKSLNEMLEEKHKLMGIKKERETIIKAKNIKVLSKTIKRFAPYIISTALASTALYHIGFGLPFIRDDLNARKVYELEYQTPQIKKVNEKYATKLIIDYFSKSELTLYTPFTLCDDETYIRRKITYKTKNIDSLKIYNALMDDDYNYIIENIVPVSDELETVNMLNDLYVNDYYVDVRLIAIDDNDVVTKREDFKSDFFVTMFDILTGFWLGLIFNRRGKKSFNEEIMDIYSDYNDKYNAFLRRYGESVFGNNLDDKIASLNEQIKGAKRL